MPSDGEAGEPRKRAPTKGKSMKTGLDEKERGSLKDKSERDGSLTLKEGMQVTVRNEENPKETLAATIVRVHRTGDVSVKYMESGKTEKHIAADRILSQIANENNEGGTFDEGDTVMFRCVDDDKDESNWRKGTIKICRKDGTFDIIDATTEEIVKKVPRDCIKTKKRVTSSSNKSRKYNDQSDEEDKLNADKAIFEVDEDVEFKDKRGKWHGGCIVKVRKDDGTYDVVHDSDDDQVTKKIASKLIRKPAKADKKKLKGGKYNQSSSIRKRKSTGASDEEEEQQNRSDSDTDSDLPRRKRKSQLRRKSGSGGRGMAFNQIRVNQVVEFEDQRGNWHRGRIKLLRNSDETCDIEHESDSEIVSKRVSMETMRPVSALSRLLWNNNANRQVTFPLNSRVFYVGKDGLERKGIVLKIWKDGANDGDGGSNNDGPCYDVEDLMDGTMFKKIPGRKLRLVPWLDYSLPKWNGSFQFFSFPQPILRKGMKVRFRHRGKGGTSSNIWRNGIIIKAKSDKTCLVECMKADGKKEQLQIKNSDIQTRFLPPLSGLFDGIQLPSIELPNLVLPTSMLKVGSAVEVSSGSQVYLGSVSSVNEQERTYTIIYDDGRKEKNVAQDRVRLSLRRLRIGTEVEMIIEGPCKEVSKLDGEVAWVHRNEKVAIRINGGNNDVFAEVCSHALMVNGHPAFTAPLSSTWSELVGYYCNLSIEVFIYLWFLFGMMVEMGEMIRLWDSTSPDVMLDVSSMVDLYSKRDVDWSTCPHTALEANGTMGALSRYLLPSTDAFVTDRSWLVVLLVTKAVLTAFCALFSSRLVYSKIMAIQDNFIDLKEYQHDRMLRRHFMIVMGAAIITSFFTLLDYASLLNHLMAYCLVTDSEKMLDLSSLAMHIDVFAIHSVYDTPVDLLLALMAKTTFNCFRAVAFFVFVFAFPMSSMHFLRRVLFLVPSIALTALMCAMGMASLHVFYYVEQVEIVSSKYEVLGLSTDTDLAIALVLVSLWFNGTLYRLVAAAGAFFDLKVEQQMTARSNVADDVLDQAERGEFGLLAKKEALVTKIEQRQEQLGICKLSILRINQHILLHIAAMIVGIYADARLRQRVQAEESSSSSVALHAMVFHLAICVLWLVFSCLASLYAIALRQESPELLAYILQV